MCTQVPVNKKIQQETNPQNFEMNLFQLSSKIQILDKKSRDWRKTSPDDYEVAKNLEVNYGIPRQLSLQRTLVF